MYREYKQLFAIIVALNVPLYFFLLPYTGRDFILLMQQVSHNR